MTARVGAIHLGWDVVSVAAGGGGTPIRPVQVEGTYTPPAYLLADKSGRLHTAGVDRQRPDLGIAVSDVRDILGHQQIRIAGATWPAELVFRARLYNPLAAIGTRLRGKPDVVALPFPDDWPDEKVEEYCRLVEQMDVVTDPLPESVALSGYVRALGLVQPPAHGRRGVGATGVYSDGRVCLVVAVDGDDEQPTESVGVPITPDSMRDAHSADNVVIEVMAAARSIGADTSTVLLTGNVCFNDALRLAFQNHLGARLRVADHPMHALVLGAAHLLVTDSEYAEAEQGPAPVSNQPGPAVSNQPGPAVPNQPGTAVPKQPGPPRPGPMQAASNQSIPNRGAPQSDSRSENAGRHAWQDAGAPEPALPPAEPHRRPEPPNPHGGAEGRHAARDLGPGSAPQPLPTGEPTTRLTREAGQLESRFTRPPAGPVDDQRTTESGGRSSAGEQPDEEEHAHKGKLWSKVKDNLFGAPTIVGAVALAALAIHADGEADHLAQPLPGHSSAAAAAAAAGTSDARTDGAAAFDARSPSGLGAGSDFGSWPAVDKVSRAPEASPACSVTPNAVERPGPGMRTVADHPCAHLAVDNLHYVVPTVPGTFDSGPPIHI
ncbi:hypothetical protein [Nocardia mikamii]|uniref:hypothetical protein n=1 Tax=Nocardia mikamii TaxID=508464 RepID=UPI001FDF45DF|nr:hypothetical protein [Nocardia mikamii]